MTLLLDSFLALQISNSRGTGIQSIFLFLLSASRQPIFY